MSICGEAVKSREVVRGAWRGGPALELGDSHTYAENLIPRVARWGTG